MHYMVRKAKEGKVKPNDGVDACYIARYMYFVFELVAYWTIGCGFLWSI